MYKNNTMAMKRTEADLMQALRGTPAPSVEPPPVLPVSLNLARGKRGRALNLYLHDEDTRLIRSLSAYLTSQGHRVSDSQVVKAALRTALADSKLVAAFEDARRLDRRYKARE